MLIVNTELKFCGIKKAIKSQLRKHNEKWIYCYFELASFAN